jgi:hypothetical protein
VPATQATTCSPSFDDAELERLRAEREVTIKREREATVEVLGSRTPVVVKTYHNRGLRLLQTLLRKSRAHREYENLVRIAPLPVETTPAVAWSEHRRAGLVFHSTLVTGFVPGTTNMKRVLADLPRSAPERRRLATATGALLASLHRGGVLWSTPMPRNLLLEGRESGGLVVCDVPAAVHFPGPVTDRTATIDLFDALFSASRRRDYTAPQRLAGLLAYTGGDRNRARALWRRLQRRGRLTHRLHKNLVMALRTYILSPLFATQIPPATTSAAPSEDERR